MSASNTKDKVLEQLEQLPPDATVEDAMERLYFLAKVERGLAESDAGETVTHEEAKRRLTGA
jgi:predicted transcriptional regulator